MRTLLATIACIALASNTYAAERQRIMPPGTKLAGPYSPGVLSGQFLYVAGQGAEGPDGKVPQSADDQIRQCLNNVKTVVEAAGLRMEHVVYVQVYLTDYSDEDRLNRVWKEVFPKMPPARSTIGVAQLNATTVEMSAVAVKDLSLKKPIVPPGYPASVPISPAVQVGDRLYLSGFLGRDINTGRIPDDPAAQVQLAFDRLEQTLKAAGADFRNMVFVNPYLTDKVPMQVMNRIYAQHFEFGNTPARATIKVAGLPNGANIEFTGVAILDLSKRHAVRPKNMEPSPTASPCVLADDTLYCSAKSGFIPGVNGGIYAPAVDTQLRQTMRNLLDGLEEAGMNFSNVVSSNVYLDDLHDFSLMNGVYAQYFGEIPPARTTVQQIAPGPRTTDAKGHYPTLEQISIVAVK
jgi:enamine deaminase RidA (YjgF/YER057c/UK114 family)